jgi:outer membrane protein OmpU
MKLRNLLLGTTAILSAGLAAVALPEVGRAAEIAPGGYPDLTISGFARFRAHGGEIDDARLDNTFSRELDFSNDTEVHVIARAKSEQTGLEYGGTIEFEADTNRTDNTDETWVFLRGGWGEVRLGDEDGVAEASQVSAATIAAGTGGLDGSVIDVFGGGPTFRIRGSSDATKIRYYTPSFGGFSVGVSYTPEQDALDSGANNGDTLALNEVDADPLDAENLVEGGLIYEGTLGGTGLLASLTGATCDWRDDTAAGDSCYGIYGGANVDLFGFKLGGGYGMDDFGGVEREFFNVGVGAALGPVNVSVNYGQLLDSDNLLVNGADVGDASNLVFSADIALAPGLVLAGDVGVFDNDADNAVTGDEGWQAVGRLGLAF